MNILRDVPGAAITTIVSFLITTIGASLATFLKKKVTTKSDRQKLSEELDVLSHHVGRSRLIGGRPSSAL
ncbi:hypothetical protein, partial [Mycolicibacterium fortuitum]|uniref:hypothetical protein n=1 Tax=Mycolicibacterium fortuitum TaxID=1766 RepID=UPI00262B7D96